MVAPLSDMDVVAVAAYALRDAYSWWDDVNESILWQNRIFHLLALFYGLLSLVALIQLVRIQLRVPEYGWTTQKVFHLLNFVVNGVRCLVFIFRRDVQQLQPEIVQHVLLDMPSLAFFTTYALLILFWAEIYHRANRESTDRLRPCFYTINALVYGIQIVMWLVMWWKPSSVEIIMSKMHFAVMSLVAALGFLLYGRRFLSQITIIHLFGMPLFISLLLGILSVSLIVFVTCGLRISGPRTPSPTQPEVSLNATASSSENLASVQNSSSPSYSRPNRLNGSPYDGGVAHSNFLNRSALRQYNLDGIAEFPEGSSGRPRKLHEVGCLTAICFLCFLVRSIMICFNVFDKAADLDVLYHPILNFIYYLLVEILPCSLVLFILRKMPSKQGDTQYRPIQ